MNCSTPGLPVHHQLPEFTQTQRPSSQWCHPAISSSVVPFSSCPQSLLASESFPMSQLFTWGGQSTGVSVLVSFLPKNTQGWSPSEWTGWISLLSKGLSRVFSNTTVQKHQFCCTSLLVSLNFQFSSVQSLSHVQLFATPWIAAHQPPCPPPTPGVYPNSCPSSRWCHPTISSSVVPFSCPQSLPASGSFPMSQLFTWGGQSIGVSTSASVLPMNTQDWSPLGWTGWISLQSKGFSRVFSNTTVNFRSSKM